MPALQAVLWTNSVGRFNGDFQAAGHFEPFYYYLGKLPEAFLPWNVLVYVGLWHFRKKLITDRYTLFFCVWLLAQFLLLTVASSKRMVYLMSLTPAAAVIAMEYLVTLGEALRARQADFPRINGLLRRQSTLVPVSMAVLVGIYLSAAFWPGQDMTLLPLTEQVRRLQAQGKTVFLFQPSERVAGASVFYSHTLLDTLQSAPQLHDVLARDPNNVAIIESQTTPVAPLKIVDQIKVGDRVYSFVSH
jgi:4-amino-4-deoxy-L-arabinose transferase-like glycosyltransferase